MSDYRFLCPECGHTFLEGTAFTHCPTCQIPLLEAPRGQTADLRKLPDHVDLDALMRQTLAEQQPEEDIDAAVRRVVGREYPDSQEGLCRLIDFQIGGWQKAQNIARQEAAEQLAKAHSELITHTGKPFEVRTVLTDTKWLGLENIPAEKREEVKAQIQQALKEGKAQQKIEITLSADGKQSKWGAIAVALSLLVLLAWRIWAATH